MFVNGSSSSSDKIRRRGTPYPRGGNDIDDDDSEEENVPPSSNEKSLLGFLNPARATRQGGKGADDKAPAGDGAANGLIPLSPSRPPLQPSGSNGNSLTSSPTQCQKWLGPSSPPPLLPEPHHSKRDRLCVVLDIDETLVCAYNATAVPMHLRQPHVAHRHRTFNLTCAGRVLSSS